MESIICKIVNFTNDKRKYLTLHRASEWFKEKEMEDTIQYPHRNIAGI